MNKQDRTKRTWEEKEIDFQRSLSQEILRPEEWPDADPAHAERWRDSAPLLSFFMQHIN